MKTIKFFSFLMLVSLVWVACKDANTTTSEADATAVLADSVFTATKQSALTNITALDQALTAKIAELEAAVASATDATKADLESQLATFKQYQTDIQGINTKVNEATAETWATVSEELQAIHMTVKSAIVSSTSEAPATPSQLTN